MIPRVRTPNQWWRWPLVPIAAFAGAQIGAMLFTLFQWFGLKMQGGFAPDGWMYMYILPLMSAFVFGYAFAAISCMVAPSSKFNAGIAMTAALATVLIGLVVFIWLTPEFSGGHKFFQTLKCIVTVFGTIGALIQQHEALT